MVPAAGRGTVAVLFAGMGNSQAGNMVHVMGGRSGPVLCATGKDSSNGEVAKDTANDDVVLFFAKLDEITAEFDRQMKAVGPDDLLMRNSNLQLKLAEVASSSGVLVRQVVAHLKPEEGSVLFADLLEIGLNIMCAEVSGKHRQAPWGYAHSVISELHGLRSLVSAALDVPIPPRRPIKLSPFLLENDIMEVSLLAIMDAE